MGEVLALFHVGFENLGWLEEVFERRGQSVRYVDAVSADLDAIDPLSPEPLVILGGPIGVYEEAAYPFLTGELQLLKQRLTADRPTLGICLGCQLMARALGARVYPGQRKEIGWAPITLTEAGRASVLEALDGMHVLHWHGDTFDIPEGAEGLASSQWYPNQAFARGPQVLGLQFHLEVTASGLEHWYVGHAAEITATRGVDVPGLRSETQKWAPTLRPPAERALQRWLEQARLD